MPDEVSAVTRERSSKVSAGKKPKVSKEKKPKKNTKKTVGGKYSPKKVAFLSNSRIKKGGKTLLSEDMDRGLREGRISKEDYEMYYPYNGTGYYSVFVETDLRRASTISGRRLKSESAIAKYIADMMLLEEDSFVEVEYAGVYKTKNGNRFYEFRCHR